MNIEKLKPWNWFKQQDNTVQIPVNHDDLHSSQGYTSNSLSRLDSQLERLLDEAWQSWAMPSMLHPIRPFSLFERPSSSSTTGVGSFAAKMNVSGSENEYEISLELPGMSEDDIQIERHADVLVVEGHSTEEKQISGHHSYQIERSISSFSRALSLPDDVDKEAISASMKNGLLRIQVPRRSQATKRTKRIDISS